MKKIVSDRILIAIAALCGALLVWFWLNVLFVPRTVTLIEEWRYAIILLSFSITVLIPFALRQVNLRKLAKFYVPAVVIFFVISFFTCFLVGYAMSSTAEWNDPSIVKEDAIHFVETGQQKVHSGYREDYFSHYPNNLGTVTLLAGLFSIAHSVGSSDYELWSLTLNVVCLIAAQVFLFLAAQRLYGRRGGVLALLLSVPLITFSPYVHITYTDTLGILFPIMTMYWFICAYKARTEKLRITYVLFLAATSAIGYYSKPTTILALLAISLIALVLLSPKKDVLKRQIRYGLAGIAAFIACFYAAGVVIKVAAVVPSDPRNEFPLTHWIAMGMVKNTNRNYTRYGGFTLDSFRETKSYPDKEARQAANIEKIKERLGEFGVFGYLGFLNDKAVWVMGDGGFNSVRYNNPKSSQLYHNDLVSQKVRAAMHRKGSKYKLTQFLQQLNWFVILNFIVLRFLWLVKSRFKSLTKIEVAVSVSILAIISFILLTEGNPRYLYSYTPIFILLAIAALSVPYPRVLGRREKPKTRSPKP